MLDSLILLNNMMMLLLEAHLPISMHTYVMYYFFFFWFCFFFFFFLVLPYLLLPSNCLNCFMIFS